MLILNLLLLSFLGIVSGCTLLSLAKGMLSIDFHSEGAFPFTVGLMKLILYFFISMGGVAVATLFLLRLRAIQFISDPFFRQVVTALFSGVFAGLILLLLGKI